MSSKKRDRLDHRVWAEGLAETIETARKLIMTGTILVNDHPVSKPGTLVSLDAHLRQKGKSLPWVSRGGLKLAHAMNHWSLEITDKVCLDVGASTGGFTHVLLHFGAQKVFAMDVGYGQLDWKLASDPRVIVMDRFNVRDLKTEDIPNGVDFVVADVSFIALSQILPLLLKVLKTKGEGVFLIKPQFELPARQIAPGGVVLDENSRQQAIATVTHQCLLLGLKVIGTTPSPITGPKGNQEYLLYCTY